ncbi:MAG: phage major capsid protein [Rickettsiales bacterium]|jgi:HK97 family phage major capsid protein|nr:phage major capsid protein [Rickettsiales bacterium]
MSITEITDRVSALGNAWEQFKSVNDARLKEIERKGHSDPLYAEHLSNINVAMDNYKKRLDQIETAYNRPALDVASDGYKSHNNEGGEYGKAFRNYLRKGLDAGLEALQTKALSVGSDPDGGYLVTPTMSSKIITAIFETSPMRQLASVETISSDALELIDDHDQATAGWTGEVTAITETNTPTLAKRNIPTNELFAQPKATQKLVDDAAVDVEAWLADKISDIFARRENTSFISGNGVNQPRGILTYASGTQWGRIEQINSGTNGAVTADAIINMFYALKDGYSKRASFLMNRTVVQSVRLLKQTSTNQYLWQPGLASGQPDTLMGVPVYMATDMPTAATNSLSVAVGDFKAGYQIVDRRGIRILRDPFTEKPFVKFYATKRVGGDVINFEAIKLMRLAA